jgi:hypothetical protein
MTRTRSSAALAVAAMLIARPAAAYVRYTVDSGAGFFWNRAAVQISAYPDDFKQSTMTTAQVQQAAAQAAATWSAGENACTFLELELSTSTAPTPIAAYDHLNALVFHSTTWCQLAADGSCELGYDPHALAVTTDTANTKTGEIYDSDIEVNAVTYNWADVVASPALSNDMDLQNALTHEMGHLIGLDHTCWNPSSNLAQPYDNTGQPVPDCATASLAVQATTMFPSANPGDTQKRTLAPDDRAGLCGIYPVGAAPGGSGGCASCAAAGAPESWTSPAGLALLTALLACARRTPRPWPRR